MAVRPGSQGDLPVLTEPERHCDRFDKGRSDLHEARKNPDHRIIPPFRLRNGIAGPGLSPGLFPLKPLVASQKTCPTPSTATGTHSGSALIAPFLSGRIVELAPRATRAS